VGLEIGFDGEAQLTSRGGPQSCELEVSGFAYAYLSFDIITTRAGFKTRKRIMMQAKLDKELW